MSLATVVAALACGKDATAPKVVPPRFKIVAGANASDTILTQFTQALVVEVRDSLGRPVAGSVVRFEAPATTDLARRYESTIVVCALTSAQCGTNFGYATFVADTTGADGRAAAIVRLGSIAGPAKVYVSVPELGLRDSAAYTVRPGSAVHVVFTVSDTMVRVGGSYAPRAMLADRYYNRRTDPVAYSTDGVVASVDAGGIVKGLAIGRGTVTASAGQLTGTASVSVVPNGRIAAHRAANGQQNALVELDLDGGNYAVRKTTSGYSDAFPTWAPDGSTITYTDAPSGSLKLFNLNAAGGTASAMSDSTIVMSEQGQYSRDGTYLYFYGQRGSTNGLWRVRTDGSAAAEYLSGVGIQPSPSPDGTRVAFNEGGYLSVLTIATGAVQRLGIPGTFPRWAPSGEEIAYTSDSYGNAYLAVVNADGSGHRALGNGYAYGVDWSPDGKWLIANHSGQLTLVRTLDGQMLPIRTTIGWMFTPIWKP